MTEERKPYIKTLEDELDWKLLDQLYGVVSQISSFCFETKKFCVTTEFVVLTILMKLTDDKLNNTVFIAGLIIPICFWFLDAIGYYYQARLRHMMDAIKERIASQSERTIFNMSGENKDLIEQIKMVLKSFVNHSMWLYILMVLIDSSVWFFYAKNI